MLYWNCRCAVARAPSPIIFLCAGAAFLLTLANSTLAAPDTIDSIAVSGNMRVDAASIRTRVSLRENKAYDAAQAEKSLQALYATGQFRNVAIEQVGRRVVITVAENSTLVSVAFAGNPAVDKSLIEPEVKLQAGDPITMAKAQAAALRIRDFYRHQGRVATTVEPVLEPLPENRAKLVFRIHEGEVMKNASIAFSGNHAFSAKQLRDVMASSESGWFDILKTSASFDAARLELDQELLLIHYRKNGFPDAKVLPPEFSENAAHTGYQISFTVDEGDRYSFSAGRIETALAGVDQVALQKLVVTAPGQTYNAELIERSVQRLTVALVDAGLPSAHVTTTTQRDREHHTLAPVYVIKDGVRVTIERINVHGNSKTKDRIIRRELKLAEGDVLSQVLADRDKERLKRLGLFKTVGMRATPGSTPDKAVLDIDVTEQDTTELSFGAGYSSSEGVIGDVAIADSNLFGNGQTVRLKLSGSQTRFQADIGFTEPRLFDSKISGGFDLLYKDADHTLQSSYKSLTAGGDLRLGTALSDTTTLGLNYSLMRNEIYGVGPAASVAIKEAVPAGASSGTYYTSSVGANVTYDDRNKRKNPTSGSYFSLGQDFAGVGGDAQYIRNTAEGRLYYPLSDQVTLVGRAAGGNIGGWGGQDVRLLDSFYKGGDIVRGFATSGIGPRDMGSANQDALGGKSFVSATAEARFSIPLIPDEIGLKGAVFTDAGSLFGVNKTAAGLPGLAGANPAARVSVGAGLIWDSPVGALGVNYAVPLAKQPFDKVQPLSFGVVPY